MKIAGFILTRDSWIWAWSKVIGLAGLIVSGVIDPKKLGLSENQHHAVMMACAAILSLSAQLSTSALPSKADAQKVTTGEPT